MSFNEYSTDDWDDEPLTKEELDEVLKYREGKKQRDFGTDIRDVEFDDE